MAIAVGDLNTDSAAQSFISLADADTYLAPEQVEAWSVARIDERNAALVRASRWLVASYRFVPLDAEGLAQVGRVAARLAAESMGRSLFAGEDAATVVASESVTVGPVSESKTYRAGVRADAAGLSLPWLRQMLAGLATPLGSSSGGTTWVLRA